jgi:segregation and condensation protein B
MNPDTLKAVLEVALLAAEAPLSLSALQALFDPETGPVPEPELITEALDALAADCTGRGIELQRVATGFRYQVRASHAIWVQRLNSDRPGRYSRAVLETLAIIAYRQPITRGEVEDIRGVAVSTSVMRTLLEREWVRVVGHREVPGRPAVYATTREFLDYFSLRSLEELPSLMDLMPLAGSAEASTDSSPDPDPGPDPAAAGDSDAAEASELKSVSG